jgi:outer membrane protein OmpA-like peptidoglycan-associated protein
VKDEDATAAVGITYRAPINATTDFYLAAGHNDLAGGRGFTAGMGFGLKTLAVQYAYVTEPEAFLDANHRLSVNFYLGEAGLLPSLFGTLRRARVEHEPRTQEILHRVVIEGNPTIRVQLELLRPEQKDSIRTVWSAPGGVVSFPGVNFAINSAVISPEFARVLDGAAQLINEHPEIGLLEIQGHTDSTGNDAINIPLSQARADEVRTYLVTQGVSASRLVAKGYGATRPIAPNETEQGRYQNRRIDIVRLR